MFKNNHDGSFRGDAGSFGYVNTTAVKMTWMRSEETIEINHSACYLEIMKILIWELYLSWQ